MNRLTPITSRIGRISIGGPGGGAGDSVLTMADGGLPISMVGGGYIRAMREPNPLTILGARLHFGYEVGVSQHTLNGSNVSQFNDLSQYEYHLTQATAANQLAYSATGGPNNLPYLAPNDADDRMGNTAVSISAGRALKFWAVVKLTAGITSAVLAVRDGNGESSGDSVFAIQKANGPDRFRPSTKDYGQSEQSPSLDTPAFNTDWNIWALEYPIGSAPVIEVAGVDGLVGGLPALGYDPPGGTEAVEYIGIGHPTVGGHAFYCLYCGENVTAAESEQIINYLTAKTGCAWAA